jgi:hypothetical protein
VRSAGQMDSILPSWEARPSNAGPRPQGIEINAAHRPHAPVQRTAVFLAPSCPARSHSVEAAVADLPSEGSAASAICAGTDPSGGHSPGNTKLLCAWSASRGGGSTGRAISCLIFAAVRAFREPHINPTNPRPDGDPHRNPTDETALCGTLVVGVKHTEITANQRLCA